MELAMTIAAPRVAEIQAADAEEPLARPYGILVEVRLVLIERANIDHRVWASNAARELAPVPFTDLDAVSVRLAGLVVARCSEGATCCGVPEEPDNRRCIDFVLGSLLHRAEPRRRVSASSLSWRLG